MKTTWNIIKAETNRTKGHAFNIFQNYLQAFNTYFLSVAEKIIQDTEYSNIKDNSIKGPNNDKDQKYYLSKSFQSSFPYINFKNRKNYSSRSLSTKNSYGYNKISTNILKICAPFISSPLNYICNKSINSGVFPTHLKHSIVKPLFKKGDKENMTNYRLILLTSFSLK
jgi:hypothetical protein